MTDPLRLTPARMTSKGEDIGDVLASIRRLIAREQADATGGTAKSTVIHPMTPAAIDHDPHGTRATDRHTAPPAAPLAHPLPDGGQAPGHPNQALAAGHASANRPAIAPAALAQAVDAAAARMADTARRVEAARAVAETPFRLDPDALIPPIGIAPQPEGRLSLTAALAVVDTAAADASPHWPTPSDAPRGPDAQFLVAPLEADRPHAPAADPPAAPVATVQPSTPQGQSSGTPLATGQAQAPEAQSPVAGVGADQPRKSGAQSFGSPVTTDRPDALDADHLVAPLAADQSHGSAAWRAGPATPDQPSVSGARPSAAPVATHQPAAEGSPWGTPSREPVGSPTTTPSLPFQEPRMSDDHPLRKLLRDAIRDELRGELGARLEGDLRAMVREELAAALTEAFSLADPGR